LITSFFSARQDPDIIVISDDDLAEEIAHGPTEIVWKNGLRIVLPFVVQEDGKNVLESVSITLMICRIINDLV
jgi:hypothetical protein